MAEVVALALAEPSVQLNVSDRLTQAATTTPNSIAVACPHRSSPSYRRQKKGDSGETYATTTFAELEADAAAIARGLIAWGVPPGTRLALLVRPGIEFITLVFALLRAGMVIVLVDPGLGRRNLLRCLQDAEPEGFVAIGMAQAARIWWRRKFPLARWNVTVGRRWFWGGLTLDQLRALGKRQPSAPSPQSLASDPAAIIFTSGSTGPPKGVLYTHCMFDTQVSEIQSMYGIEPGGVDLSCFPLFALFNAAMGVTTVLPEMDFSRPASAEPKKLLAAASDWQVTQAFASPAVWRVVSDYCEKSAERIPSLRQVFSCGAPVPATVLRKTLACVAPGAKMHTPYGATECLPVSTIEAREVLEAAAIRTDEGAGVCVGRKFDSIEWRVIRITDDPIATIDDAEELMPGDVGELIVRGAQASPRYVTQAGHNAFAKIHDTREETQPWHRTGDVGYLDDAGRFWYCGRKSHRVETNFGTLFTECIEAVFNRHPDIQKSALLGIGQPPDQLPVVAIKFRPESQIVRLAGRSSFPDFDSLASKVWPATLVSDWIDIVEMPVDVRHNSKINRELLRERAAMFILFIEPGQFHPELVTRAHTWFPSFMHALVTGGGGFLGGYIVEALLARGDRVRSFGRGDYPQLRTQGVEIVRGDIRDGDAVAAACRDIDCVFHAAAMPGIGMRQKVYDEVNRVGTQHVLAGCRAAGVPRLVYTSSPSVVFAGADQCGIDESTAYGFEWLKAHRAYYSLSKAQAEQEVLAANDANLKTCALRPHLIWGPGDTHLIPRLIARARSGRLRRVGDGTNLVDITYVENAADAHLQAADALTSTAPSAAGKAYFLSQGKPVNCWQWIDEILSLVELPPVKKAMSLKFAWQIGFACEFAYRLLPLNGEPPMTRFLATQLAKSHWFDISASRRDLSYEPRVSMADGMNRLGEWLLKTR